MSNSANTSHIRLHEIFIQWKSGIRMFVTYLHIHICTWLVDALFACYYGLWVSIPKVERVLSRSKIIKTRLGGMMEDDFLAIRMLVLIEGETAVHYNYEDTRLYIWRKRSNTLVFLHVQAYLFWCYSDMILTQMWTKSLNTSVIINCGTISLLVWHIVIVGCTELIAPLSFCIPPIHWTQSTNLSKLKIIAPPLETEMNNKKTETCADAVLYDWTWKNKSIYAYVPIMMRKWNQNMS